MRVKVKYEIILFAKKKTNTLRKQRYGTVAMHNAYIEYNFLKIKSKRITYSLCSCKGA